MAMNFSIDHDDAINAIRSHFRLPNSVVISINPQPAAVEVPDDTWIEVPADYREGRPPLAAAMNAYIEVQFRDGTFDSGKPYDWAVCWMQTGDDVDIVRYRSSHS